MAGKNNEIKIDYKVVNTAFNQGIKEIKSEVTTLNKEFALQKEQMKLSATESEKLEANIEKLNAEYASAQQQTRLTQSAYENVVAIMGEGSKEAQTWSNKLLDAQKNEQFLANSIEEKTNALEKSNEITRKAAEEQTKLETNTKRLQTLFDATETSLDDYVDVLGTRLVSAIRDGEASSDQLELAINKVGKSAIDTEVDLSELKQTLDKVDDDGNIDEVRADIKQMGETADDTTPKLDEMTDALKGEALLEASEHLKEISDKIVEIGKDAIESAATVRATDAQFEQVFGSAEGVADDAVNSMSESFGILPERLKAPFASTTSMFLGLGVDIDTAMAMSTDALTIAADSAAFYDRSLEETQGSLNSFLKGNYEGGEAIGIFANETQMAAYAIKNNLIEATEEQQKHAEKSALAVEKAQERYDKAVQKYGEGSLEARDALSKLNTEIEKQEDGPNLTSKWQNLTEAQKQNIRLDYAKHMQEQSGAMGQAAREADGYENVMANLESIIDTFMATIGEPALEIFLGLVEELVPMIQAMGEWFQNLNPQIKEMVVIVLAVTAAVGAVLPIILAVKGAMLLLGTAFGPVVIGIGAVIAIVTALIMIFMNWETVLAWVTELFANFGIDISGVWQSIWGIITSIVSSISSYIMSVFGMAVAWWNENSELIALTASTVWNFILGVITAVLDFIGPYISTAVSTWQTIFSIAWDIIKTIVDTGINLVLGVIKAVMQLITGDFDGAWETIKITASSAWDGILQTASSTWTKIKDAIVKPIQLAKETIAGVVDGIKGLLSSIKAPSIVKTGSSKILGIEIPKFGIRWNAEGGIFSRPTIIGQYGGQLQGVGEAGPEAVIPLNQSVLASIGAGISQTMNNDAILERLEALIDLEERMLDKDTLINMFMNDREVARGISTPLNNYQQTQNDRGTRLRGDW